MCICVHTFIILPLTFALARSSSMWDLWALFVFIWNEREKQKNISNATTSFGCLPDTPNPHHSNLGFLMQKHQAISDPSMQAKDQAADVCVRTEHKC